MNDHILKGLNEKQVEAVKTVDGPVLVISGPGSGKTRCLTHRVAFLISSGLNPVHVLAITFTNKAANEMKERISALLSSPDDFEQPAMPTIGTFHSICVRILRKEIPVLGYKSNFNILDTDEQLTFIKRAMAELELDTKRYNPRAMLNKISKLKTDLISPEQYHPNDFMEKLVSRIYTLYQAELKKLNLLDFDDLITFTVKIFKTKPEILEKYQARWKYILVDEYQDTSHDQYQLIKLLAQRYKNLFVIGDDAQSIYAFREADIRNILNFQKDYPEAKVIMLEQNYRSTQTILTAAQSIISKNKNQFPKTLWTENQEGQKILVKETLNERTEASFIVQQIVEQMKAGKNLHDFTILYRTHAQSRAVEEALVSHGFPYQIVGGIKFYERKEIKDVLAYLKLIHNPQDILSFERIFNVPTRGIGEATYEKIIATGESNLIEAVAAFGKTQSKSKKTDSLGNFYTLLKDIETTANQENLTSTIGYIIDRIEYEQYLKSLSTSKGSTSYENVEERMENLKELLTVARKYNSVEPAEGRQQFLEEISLIQGTDTAEGPSRITLMTIHSSKGLEFPVVFIVGMEEGLFPHARTVFAPHEMEEERRLCYVAITRAKEQLVITHAKYRNIFGVTEVNLASRFISEIPKEIVDYRLVSNNGYEEETIIY
ncbi:UvrD-helicase domain-containing protein [Candidatus Parcubacteria bacterium]|nr:UvrD-helicase domain-containing protein [Candidatus Parcubacteria bacterium]